MKANRVQMAQIVAYANFPEMKRFPANDHIAVRKELKRNFRNLKEQYGPAVERLKAEGRKVPIALLEDV